MRGVPVTIACAGMLFLSWTAAQADGVGYWKTALSQKAIQLKIGLTRTQVVGMLGKPSWAILPKDRGEWALPDKAVVFELYWKNGKCNPVVAQFMRRKGKVVLTGWDEGSSNLQ